MKFFYKARSENGESRSGVLDFPNAELAAGYLRELGLIPVSISAVTPQSSFGTVARSAWESLRAVGTISLREKTLFFRQLETFIAAGVSLGAALQHLAENTSCRPLAKKVRRMRADVDEGRSLSKSMADCGVFDALSQAVAAVGEETGRLDSSLAIIAAQYERRGALRKKILSALTYPGIVLFFSAAVLFVLFHHILPRFKEVFAHMNADLPPLTARIFSLSENLPALALYAALGVAALLVLLKALRHFQEVRMKMDSLVLRVPVLGRLIAKSSAARCMRALGMLLESGVPLLRSLELSSRVTRNSAVAAALSSLRDAASTGESLAARASEQKVFEPMVAQLISAGEQTGQLEKMLIKIAEWYELDVEESVKRLTSIVEPCLILVVGVVAAVVVFALFAPILSVVQTLSLRS